MKAQFAVLEAIISLTVAISITIFCVNAISSEGRASAISETQLRLSAAEYDFIEGIYGNVSMSACMKSYVSGNTGCMAKYERYYERTYGLASFHVAGENGSGNGEIRCFPYLNYTEICISAG